MTVAVVSRNLVYRMGGAEVSLREELAKKWATAHLELVYLDQPSCKNTIDYSGMDVKLVPVKGIKPWSGFFDIEVAAHSRSIIRHLDALNPSEVVTQGKWAPLAVEFAVSKGAASTYYIRDESSINITKNYKFGYRRYAKYAQMAVELPFAKHNAHRNLRALRAATKVVANSHYMANLLYETHGVESEVVYPHVDVARLKSEYDAIRSQHPELSDSTRKRVVLIGDGEVKGIAIFLQLARRFPEFDFIVYSHRTGQTTTSGNVTYKPWTSTPASAYAEADLVLMPSIWDEAFGRVAVEASALGLPCIVSNRGGLPEAVNHDERLIARDVDEFEKKIRDVLS